MTPFQQFSALVHKRFTELSQHELFVVGEDKTAFSDAYLASFLEGTNPMYKTSTEHDCSCCKNFIRHLGNLVAIVDGRVETVWDIDCPPAPYGVVAIAMAEFTRSQPIVRVFRTKEGSYGAEETLQKLESGVKRWNHFHGQVAARHKCADPEAKRGEHTAGLQVLGRGLDELTTSALETVLDLINSNNLYRGEEHRHAVATFMLQHRKYHALADGARSLLIWENALAPWARFRNTVIGTLVQDLSAGVEVEQAVRSFESKVAPTNYKRPKALITPAMVKSAMATITELGLEPALERRFARTSDLSVNNVLWVNNSTQARMKGGIEDVLMAAATAPAMNTDLAEAITMEDFMQRVVPQATGMELLLSGAHLPHFMSLTAPQHEGTAHLFKWPNAFAWSYEGNVADSIKEKVKRAGGNVTNAKLRVSLAWSNYDDLDIHVIEPDGNHIHFGNKSDKLDVDMNAGGPRSRQAVENVSWKRLVDGIYQVFVHQYCQRETTDVGCTVEIENEGKITQLNCPGTLSGRTDFCTIAMKNGVITKLTLADGIAGGSTSHEKWGVMTEAAVKVNMLLHSPNHWGGHAVGNKHWFFILEGCKNPDAARGIYNEFLSNELDKHRKVFEVLGDKTKCAPSDDQLSGLGFSSTRADTVTVKVTGPKMNKLYTVAFGSGITETTTSTQNQHEHENAV